MGFAAKVVQDSVSPNGVRLTTMEARFPRIILAELNTHRMFSRNSASSRAIPVTRMMEQVRTDPFIPVHFGKNQPGMQANAELEGDARKCAEEAWLAASVDALRYAQVLLDLGLHKQITNRLLEPPNCQSMRSWCSCAKRRPRCRMRHWEFRAA